MEPQYITWYPKGGGGWAVCLAMARDVSFTQESIRLKVRGPAYIVGAPEGI